MHDNQDRLFDLMFVKPFSLRIAKPIDNFNLQKKSSHSACTSRDMEGFNFYHREKESTQLERHKK